MTRPQMTAMPRVSAGNLLDGFAIARDERWPLDQIAGRISAHRQLGKQNQSRAARLRAAGVVDDLGGVAGEVSDRGVDLAERNLHICSVKHERGLRLSGFGFGCSNVSPFGRCATLRQHDSSPVLIASCWKDRVFRRGHRRVAFLVAPQNFVQACGSSGVGAGEIHFCGFFCASSVAFVRFVDQAILQVADSPP